MHLLQLLLLQQLLLFSVRTLLCIRTCIQITLGIPTLTRDFVKSRQQLLQSPVVAPNPSHFTVTQTPYRERQTEYTHSQKDGCTASQCPYCAMSTLQHKERKERDWWWSPSATHPSPGWSPRRARCCRQSQTSFPPLPSLHSLPTSYSCPWSWCSSTSTRNSLLRLPDRASRNSHTEKRMPLGFGPLFLPHYYLLRVKKEMALPKSVLLLA